MNANKQPHVCRHFITHSIRQLFICNTMLYVISVCDIITFATLCFQLESSTFYLQNEKLCLKIKIDVYELTERKTKHIMPRPTNSLQYTNPCLNTKIDVYELTECKTKHRMPRPTHLDVTSSIFPYDVHQGRQLKKISLRKPIYVTSRSRVTSPWAKL